MTDRSRVAGAVLALVVAGAGLAACTSRPSVPEPITAELVGTGVDKTQSAPRPTLVFRFKNRSSVARKVERYVLEIGGKSVEFSPTDELVVPAEGTVTRETHTSVRVSVESVAAATSAK